MKNMKIQMKLFVGFAVVLLLTVVVAVFGANRILHVDSEYTYALSYPRERYELMHSLSHNLTESRRVLNRAVMYIFEPHTVAERLPIRIAALQANHQSSGELIARYIANLHSDPRVEPERRDYLLGVMARYQAAIDHYADYYVFNVVRAIQELDGPGAMARADALSGHVAMASELYRYMMASAQDYMDTVAEELGGQTRFTVTIVVVITVVSVIIGVLIAIYISILITKPIHEVSYLIESVSKGNLEINFRDNLPTDEVGVMTKNTYNMAKTIKQMVDDIDKFTYENKVNGDIEARIDADKYQGSYQKMLVAINEFTEDYTQGIIDLLDGLGKINKGNFDVDVKDMPGKKMVMPNTFRATRANIQGVSTELNSMIAAIADKGDLTFQIDANKYEGDWRDIMAGLNKIASAVEDPLKTIEIAMNEMKAGNLDLTAINRKITAEGYTADPDKFKGTFSQIVATFDSVINETASYINEIEKILSEMSKGDLRNKITRPYVGSFDLIKSSLNNINESLHKTMSEINSASEQVLSGAKQISSSSMDLANGASTQASSVQELNASVDLINQQTRQNADNASKANTLSQTSTDNAKEGNNAMQQTLGAMNQIKDSSNNISKIIKTIQDIAFQTNLLALNAAVEAARAGEHGKGFAVVAEEVRSLAARSQAAASETTELIGSSITTVETGSEIAQSTAETLNTIVDNANKVLDIVSNISTSSQEQAEAISQVVQGLQQISQVVQSNSAVSEEAAASSEELTSQAELLQQLVGFFKL